jgi:hypothetical protein
MDDKDMQEYIDKYCTPMDIENYEAFIMGVHNAGPQKSVQMIRAWMKVNIESSMAPIGNN